MIRQIDERLLCLTTTLWKPRDFTHDPTIVPPRVMPSGCVVVESTAVDGPETDSERFFTAVWHSAKPSRWKTQIDPTIRVTVNESGKIVGPIGYDFRFVRNRDEADGKTTFVIPWEVI